MGVAFVRTHEMTSMSIPLTKSCSECQGEMELITADDVGEILIYECPECGHQEETRVEKVDTEDDLLSSDQEGPGSDEDDAGGRWPEPDKGR